ncbi:MAG: hypothetical protein R3F56_05480 [Planctomycetota bacterium]
MSRKLVVALFAFLFAAITAWAEPGGDGGCVNLPGGRGGSRPGASSTGELWQATAQARNGVRFRLPSDMKDSVALVRGATLPFAFLMMPENGELHVSAPMLAAVHRANEVGFVLDFFNALGERLTAHVLVRGSQVQVFVE